MTKSERVRENYFLSREFNRVRKNRRRARDVGAKATLTQTEWIDILTKNRWACVFCKRHEITMEHLVPLRMGGGTTAKNCVPACDRCNAGFDRSSRNGVN